MFCKIIVTMFHLNILSYLSLKNSTNKLLIFFLSIFRFPENTIPSFFHEPITFPEGRVISSSLREALLLMILLTIFFNTSGTCTFFDIFCNLNNCFFMSRGFSGKNRDGVSSSCRYPAHVIDCIPDVLIYFCKGKVVLHFFS